MNEKWFNIVTAIVLILLCIGLLGAVAGMWYAALTGGH